MAIVDRSLILERNYNIIAFAVKGKRTILLNPISLSILFRSHKHLSFCFLKITSEKIPSVELNPHNFASHALELLRCVIELNEDALDEPQYLFHCSLLSLYSGQFAHFDAITKWYNRPTAAVIRKVQGKRELNNQLTVWDSILFLWIIQMLVTIGNTNPAIIGIDEK